MQIRRVHAVYFSGTGTTEKTVRRIAAQAAQQLGAELSAMDFTPPQARQETLHFAPEELVIFGVPTYAGRVPNVLLPFLKERVQGGGALAAAVVLFGNRNFDDSLIELRDILCADGFAVVGGAVFVGEHSFSRTLGAGRPDAADMAEMALPTVKLRMKPAASRMASRTRERMSRPERLAVAMVRA